jgi:hypothetical protein
MNECGIPKEIEARIQAIDPSADLLDIMLFRDKCAIAAMEGMLTGIKWHPALLVHEDKLAEDAYAIAEEMMKARLK